MNDILTLFRESWPFLFGTVCGLVTFIYMSDRRSIGERFESAKKRNDELVARVLIVESNYIQRHSVEAMVDKVEEKFRHDHENIIDVLNQRHEEVMRRLNTLDDRIMAIVGMRDTDRQGR